MKAALSLSIAVLMIACGSVDTMNSSDINPERIHGSYAVTFHEETQELKAESQFRAGGPTGTTLRLDKGASVTFDDEPLQERGPSPFTGTDYALTKKPSLPEGAHAFVWTRNDGKTFRYETTIPSAVHVAKVDEKLSLKSGFQVEVSRQEGAGKVSCALSWKKDGITTSMTRQASEKKCTFAADDLKETGAGAAVIEVSHEFIQTPLTGHEGGQLQAVFKAKPVPVQLVD